MNSFTMKTTNFPLVLFLLSGVTAAGTGSNKELADIILRNYARGYPPDEGNVSVILSLYLYSFTVDAENNELSVIAGIGQEWTDKRLSWEKYQNKIDLLATRMPDKYIWKPDIVLANPVKPETVMVPPDTAAVYMTGKVSYYKLVRLTTRCNFTQTEDNRYDCELKFQSWNYAVDTINLQDIKTILHGYQPSGMWVLANSTVTRNTENLLTGTYVQVIQTFTIEKRQPEVKETVNSPGLSALPVILLGFLVPFQFLIPLECKERLTFDGILILAGTIVAVAVYDVAPAIKLPLSFESYCDYILILLFLGVALSIINVHMCTSAGKRLPILNFLKKNLFSGANRIVGVAVPKDKVVRVKRPHIIIDYPSEDQTADAIPLAEKRDSPEKEKLEEIVDILVPMAEERGRCEAESILKQEWLAVGLILDRLMFVLFFLVYVFCSLGFIG